MIVNQHTRNQKRMYRIHKLEEKIHNQDLLIGSLKQRINKANNELITLIQIINEQPSNNKEEDNYLLGRLESISNILGGNNE